MKTFKKVVSAKRAGLTGCRKTIDVVERATRSVSGIRDLMMADCSNGDADEQLLQDPRRQSCKPRNRKPLSAGSCVNSFGDISFPSKLGCQKNPLSESFRRVRDWRDGAAAVAKNHDGENTYHKHLHHHHHHHHHHHYLHHPLASESVRLSQETLEISCMS
ncbi:hypothetical protein KP509_35G019200 [Ceratopteris richardii]|nr:hypothetical protein KP509_35G019200 [Ceratopteris richardii]